MHFSDPEIIPTAQEKLTFNDLRRHRRIIVCQYVRDLAVGRLRDPNDTINVTNLRNAIHDLLALETEIAQHNRQRTEARR